MKRFKLKRSGANCKHKTFSDRIIEEMFRANFKFHVNNVLLEQFSIEFLKMILTSIDKIVIFGGRLDTRP